MSLPELCAAWSCRVTVFPHDLVHQEQAESLGSKGELCKWGFLNTACPWLRRGPAGHLGAESPLLLFLRLQKLSGPPEVLSRKKRHSGYLDGGLRVMVMQWGL